MLRMVLKNGESIRLGDDIVVKSMTEGRCELAIDAPKEIKIERLDESGTPVNKSVAKPSTIKPQSKKVVIVNHKA